MSGAAGSQWYEKNPKLQEMEILAMHQHAPEAIWGYMPNGDMYWDLALPIEKADGGKRDWQMLAVYPMRHGEDNWLPVYFHFVRPNYPEMLQLVEEAPVLPKKVPHILHDAEGNVFPAVYIDHMRKFPGDNRIATAATWMLAVIRWLSVFEQGLGDQEIWNQFCSP